MKIDSDVEKTALDVALHSVSKMRRYARLDKTFVNYETRLSRIPHEFASF